MAEMEIISWVTPSGVETVLSDNDFIHVVGWGRFANGRFAPH